MVYAIIDGAARFAEVEYAPLNRSGDIQGAKWNGGAVTMPEGFREAYQAFVENGWGAINGPEDFGGQGLPFALFSVVMEDLGRSEEHTSELQSLMRISYAVFCLKKKNTRQ